MVKNCLSLHDNEANRYLFVTGVEIIKFKAKDSEIKQIPFCLGNISKGFLLDNMKNAGLNGSVYDFSVDYGTISVDDYIRHSQLVDEKAWYSKNEMFRFVEKCSLLQCCLLVVTH